MDWLQLVILVASLGLAAYFLRNARALAQSPRRGTAVRLPRWGYVVLGCVWLLLAVSALVTLVA